MVVIIKGRTRQEYITKKNIKKIERKKLHIKKNYVISSYEPNLQLVIAVVQLDRRQSLGVGVEIGLKGYNSNNNFN